jgi:transcriptional regulator with XRE-family HTH domain
MIDDFSEEWVISELKKIRREKNITLRELAAKMNIKPATLESYETLQNDPRAHTLFRWAKALGYGLDLFLMERNREAAE